MTEAHKQAMSMALEVAGFMEQQSRKIAELESRLSRSYLEKSEIQDLIDLASRESENAHPDNRAHIDYWVHVVHKLMEMLKNADPVVSAHGDEENTY